jgi:CO/xanthine dehydrogenase Mo-binding subunit
MEPRGALAHYLPATGELTLWNTTQNPHIVRFIVSLVCGIPEDRLRVIAPEVGGGFGSKIPQIQGDFITVFCSMKLGRPVKWIESRSENYQSTTHGRDHVQDVEMAATKDGRILGLRCTVWAGMGAYLSTAAPGIPTILHGLMLSGPYQIGAVKEDVYGVYTNTTPVEAYRGAGRPEATFMLERVIDRLADELKMDPAELRKKNLIPTVRERPRRCDRVSSTTAEIIRLRWTRCWGTWITLVSGRSRLSSGRRGVTSGLASACTSRSAGSGRRRSPAPSASRADCGRAPSSASIRAERRTSSSVRHRMVRAKKRRSHRSSPTSSASALAT